MNLNISVITLYVNGLRGLKSAEQKNQFQWILRRCLKQRPWEEFPPITPIQIFDNTLFCFWLFLSHTPSTVLVMTYRKLHHHLDLFLLRRPPTFGQWPPPLASFLQAHLPWLTLPPQASTATGLQPARYPHHSLQIFFSRFTISTLYIFIFFNLLSLSLECISDLSTATYTVSHIFLHI